MAPKAAVAKYGKPPQIKARGVLIHLHEISVSETSGWRPQDPSRQQGILEALRSGSLGHHIMREPQVAVSCVTGKYLLDIAEARVDYDAHFPVRNINVMHVPNIGRTAETNLGPHSHC